ncbi:TIGR03905 family TSCPD domain-containing protein [Maridesulfovibrio hydrothermalis]
MENITIQPNIMTPPESLTTPAGTEIFIPKGVCAKQINFAVEDGKLSYLNFTGGCDGNLKAVSALTEGMELEDIIRKLSGITCGKKSTSCPDQLCCALREYINEKE